MIAYLRLVRLVLEGGRDRPPARAGLPGTRALFGASLDADMREGFPLITTREMRPGGVLGELSAFLRGTSKLSDFEAEGCSYWRADAERWAPGRDSVGRTYGVQWRSWRSFDPLGLRVTYTDQIAELLRGLRTNPFGRRHLLTAWNPGELGQMCLPPCHVMAQFSFADVGTLDAMVVMRSVDLMLGLPSDLVLYGALLHLIALEVGASPGRLVFFLGDAHIYENHFEQAQEQLSRQPRALPKAVVDASIRGKWAHKSTGRDWLSFEGYEPHPPVKYALNAGS